MTWTVVWHPAVADKLAELWMEARDRNAVTQAVNRIDQSLRHDAEKQGIEFYGDRLFVEPPLSVVFHPAVDDRLVKILDVCLHEPRES